MSAKTGSTYDGLTGKQRLFVDAYIGAANCNASEAARSAGYACPGIEGFRTLKNPKIRAAIDEVMRERFMPSEEILFRLTAQARGNLLDIVTPGGNLPETLDGLTREQAAIIKKHKVTTSATGGSVAVELYDAQAALLALAKRYDLFPDRVDVLFAGRSDAELEHFVKTGEWPDE